MLVKIYFEDTRYLIVSYLYRPERKLKPFLSRYFSQYQIR